MNSPLATEAPGLACEGSVLLIEDNLRIRLELSQVLDAAGMQTTCAGDGDGMRECLSLQAYDLVLLDLNLPGEDGLSLCRWLRTTYPDIGIVMLTARVMGSERTEGYEAGADIYLTKPTRPAELLAVIRNLLRRIRGRVPPTQAIAAQGWVLHVHEMRLESPGQQSLRLNARETRILRTLAQSSDTTPHQALLAARLYSDAAQSIDKGQLEVIVSRLRTKLASLEGPGLEIKTVYKLGYRLSCPVKVRAGSLQTTKA